MTKLARDADTVKLSTSKSVATIKRRFYLIKKCTCGCGKRILVIVPDEALSEPVRARRSSEAGAKLFEPRA
jgi:hypothetical protein